MPENDHTHEHRLTRGDFSRDRFRTPAFGLGIDDLNRIAMVPSVASDEPTPKRGFDGAKFHA